MSYRVVYGPEQVKSTRNGRKWLFPALVCGFFLLFCGFARLFYWQELELIYQILLPNSAMEVLVGQIKEGEEIVQAVAAFCEDMLHGR